MPYDNNGNFWNLRISHEVVCRSVTLSNLKPDNSLSSTLITKYVFTRLKLLHLYSSNSPMIYLYSKRDNPVYFCLLYEFIS